MSSLRGLKRGKQKHEGTFKPSERRKGPAKPVSLMNRVSAQRAYINDRLVAQGLAHTAVKED